MDLVGVGNVGWHMDKNISEIAIGRVTRNPLHSYAPGAELSSYTLGIRQI